MRVLVVGWEAEWERFDLGVCEAVAVGAEVMSIGSVAMAFWYLKMCWALVWSGAEAPEALFLVVRTSLVVSIIRELIPGLASSFQTEIELCIAFHKITFKVVMGAPSSRVAAASVAF